MNDTRASRSGDRLNHLLSILRDTPGIAGYVDLFPRLAPDHLESLIDEERTPKQVAADLLINAARQGPSDTTTAAAMYRTRGELPALRDVADAETVAAATVEWQRLIDQLISQAESRATLWDVEGVRVPDGLTWVKRVREIRDLVSNEYIDRPASQKAVIETCLRQMDSALDAEKLHIGARLDRASAELEGKRHSLDEEVRRRCLEYASAARREMDGDNLMIALRKIGSLEALVRGRAIGRPDDDRPRRLPLPHRRNPADRGNFHFETLITAARRGAEDIARRNLEEFLPTADAIEEARQVNGFLHRHSPRRVPDWSSYFPALREWLGLSESRPTKRGRLQRLELPELEPKGANLPGRWTFLTTEPWDGAPFYEDGDGRPRVLAVVRLAVADADRDRSHIILKHAGRALDELLGALPAAASEDEKRFRDDGLVLVLLPGGVLTGKKYEQFRRQVPSEKAARWSGRIAYLDDLDLLRVLPVRTDDRFRALLEAALPRFTDALSQTYQNSDAVRSRMFFGRRDELARLKNGTTVVFSGRKMGKSSLLHRLRSQCGQDTDQRAVMVGCSAIASGRSWLLLREIERELVRLLQREDPEAGAAAGEAPPGPFDEDPVEAMRVSKDRFRSFLDSIMPRLKERGVRQLYVLLDEADNFVRAELEETSGGKNPRSAVSWFLRDLQTSIYPGRLRFIFAGYDQIGRIFRDPGLGHSAFGNWGEPPLRLGPLEMEAARELVVQPLTALGMTVEDDLAERILDYTSGHASLIQTFCRKLAERIREAQATWPLEDVAVTFEDIQAVAEDQGVAGDQGYRQLLEQTLGLNLDIARAYPLKLVFLALVSPTGLGFGRVLGSDSFELEDALEQLRSPDDGQALPPTLVLDTLDLLAQLGLLEDVSDNQTRAYSFKARHYVNVLRTKNGFRDQLRQAMDERERSGRRASQAEPRYVWTLADSDLRSLRRPSRRPAVVVGLPRTGRGYLAEMLAAPLPGGATTMRLSPADPGFSTRLGELLSTGGDGLILVTDPGDTVAWEQLSNWLLQAEQVGVPLRWVGGPRLAWDLAADMEVALRVDGPYGLGPLTAAELEPWTARELGGEGPPSAASVPEAEREPILRVTGGILPVLELLREWLRTTQGQFPDPLRLAHVERYKEVLIAQPVRVARAAGRLAYGLPHELRSGLHHLYTQARRWEATTLSRANLTDAEFCPELAANGAEATDRLLEAAGWLGLLPVRGSTGLLVLPEDSLLGLLIQEPGFVSQ